MQEDIFDIVDENDQVVGQATRSRAHAEKLRHRAVHVLIFNDEGEVFLQKRAMSKDSWPGAWDSSCSGHVDQGEDYLTAAHRELDEELGYTATKPLEFLFQLTPCDATGQEFINVYRDTGNGPFRLNHDEIEIGEWKPISKLLEGIGFTPNRYSSALRLILEKLQAMQQLPAS
ncbi:NUDIX hydrolase [Pelagicoccus albus]|uniref:NUDIX domain-containing protein n=1 Tax=Pelagicoccus albus TaxID=415222 RepID=A0A7X1B8V6_9BACT|nr:NUDIX domain-containing protein [Pelagicoccus albus]MBC2607711.1 NUDIX domain-containing protein [Pelagicoccus albus]